MKCQRHAQYLENITTTVHEKKEIKMVVCKYFQQGSCRFGQSCRFDHIYGSKYSYHANTAIASTAQSAQGAITDEQLVAQVQSDIQGVLKGKQWLLSAYAPFKEKPNFPGLSDLSPEEARLFIYEAKANNNLQQAASYFNNLTQEARTKHEQLLQPTPNLIKIFRSLYKGETPIYSGAQPSNSFGGSNVNTAATSIFRSAAQSSSVFGSSNAAPSSVFGSQTNNAFQKPEAAKSIFAQASQNAFGNTQPSAQTSVFGTQQAPNPSNLFSNASQTFFGSPSTPFGQPQATAPTNVFQKVEAPSQSVFSQNTGFGNTSPNVFASNQSNTGSFFGQPAQNMNVFGQSSPNNVFAKSTSVFGQPAGNVGQQTNDDRGIYSKIEDLSAEDIEAYKSSEFKLGFIPELPPTHSLCTI